MCWNSRIKTKLQQKTMEKSSVETESVNTMNVSETSNVNNNTFGGKYPKIIEYLESGDGAVIEKVLTLILYARIKLNYAVDPNEPFAKRATEIDSTMFNDPDETEYNVLLLQFVMTGMALISKCDFGEDIKEKLNAKMVSYMAGIINE